MKKQDLSSQMQCIIACCQSKPTQKDIGFIRSYLSQITNHQLPITNYQPLITAAMQHGVLPLVYKTLKKLYDDDCLRDPSDVNSKAYNEPSQSNNIHSSLLTPHSSLENILIELKAHYMSISRRNMLMTAELLRIMKLLEANGIKAIAFKGPALAQQAYGNITLRQFGDLDLLTKKENVYKIEALLKIYGYERLLTLTPSQEKIWFKYAHDLGLINAPKGIHFEMHWSLMDEDYPMQINQKDFWEERQTLKINAHPLSTFSNENLLYYLCIHGSKHLWERIEWIKDIDLLIQTQTIEWDAFMRKTVGSGFEKMVYLGLLLSASLFATPLPTMIQQEIKKYQQLDILLSFILESWQTPQSTFQKTHMMMRLFPNLKNKILYLHKVILKPSFNEYWFIDLPKGMYWGYYLVRPYLLIKKYVSKYV